MSRPRTGAVLVRRRSQAATAHTGVGVAAQTHCYNGWIQIPCVEGIGGFPQFCVKFIRKREVQGPQEPGKQWASLNLIKSVEKCKAVFGCRAHNATNQRHQIWKPQRSDTRRADKV